MVDKEKLRERLMAVWQFKCYTTLRMAEEIGISAITFRRFAYNEGSIHPSTLMKIEKWVSDMEREHERSNSCTQ